MMRLARMAVTSVAMMTIFIAPLRALAADVPVSSSRPLDAYCQKIKSALTANAERFPTDREVCIEAAFDARGKVVEMRVPGTDAPTDLQKKAQDVVGSINSFDEPPTTSKLPLWLAITTSKKTDKIAVSVRDGTYGPYMAELQRKIKHAWFPPKGSETLRITAMFKLYKDGKMSYLRLSKSSDVAIANDAALQAVKNAQPFDPLPDGSPSDVDIQFTFDYNVFNKKGALTAPSTKSNSGGDKFATTKPAEVSAPPKASGDSALCLKQGMTALEQKDYPMAIQFLECALAIDPQNDTAKKSASIAYTSFGQSQLKSNPQNALKNFQKAKQLWPENPMTPDTLEDAEKIFGKQSDAETTAPTNSSTSNSSAGDAEKK